MPNPPGAAPISPKDFVVELRKNDPDYSILIPFGKWLEATNRAETPRIERDLEYFAQQLKPYHLPGCDQFEYKGPEPHQIDAYERGVINTFFSHAQRVKLIKVGEGASESSRTVKFKMRQTSDGVVKNKTMTIPASQVLYVSDESFVPAWFIFKKLEDKMSGPQLSRATSWVRDGDQQYCQVDHGFKFLDEDLCWPHASDFLDCMNMVRQRREDLIAELPRLCAQAWLAGQPQRDAHDAKKAELNAKNAGMTTWRQRMEAAKKERSQSSSSDSNG